MLFVLPEFEKLLANSLNIFLAKEKEIHTEAILFTIEVTQTEK